MVIPSVFTGSLFLFLHTEFSVVHAWPLVRIQSHFENNLTVEQDGKNVNFVSAFAAAIAFCVR